ncbi:hypothetical protein GTS_49420 [Gandjariella thermophila]|uniref:Uncharacterized protein n=1 Tax=Gandjariella thermophila TaxID=1931992 RepID=A0A4D4JG55_9PSEU|nr:hypothetical protein GTS_49420 [Gandjariella thermophila]
MISCHRLDRASTSRTSLLAQRDCSSCTTPVRVGTALAVRDRDAGAGAATTWVGFAEGSIERPVEAAVVAMRMTTGFALGWAPEVAAERWR